MTRSANRRRRHVEFSVNDLVYISTANLRFPARLSRKLAPLFVGPFPIIACINPVAFRVDLPPEYANIHNVFHVS